MTSMKDPKFWEDEARLTAHLGKQLSVGRLGLILGAGVSQGFGLPSWDDLVDRVSNEAGLGPYDPHATGADPKKRIQVVRGEKFKNDEQGFNALVKESLYKTANVSFKLLNTYPLLQAIGSLVMFSRRGSAASVVTLNFDDVLETYLEYFGFNVTPVAEQIHWAPTGDVVVYHPHGFLPKSTTWQPSKSIVLSSKDFFTAIANDPRNGWRAQLSTLMRTHTFLHIGLSGEDMNIESLLHLVQTMHPGRAEARYTAVRFEREGKRDEETSAHLKDYDVFTHVVKDWDALPEFLLKICQVARSQRVV